MGENPKLDFEKWAANTPAWLGNIEAAVHVDPKDCPLGRDGCEKGSARTGWDLCPWFMGSKSKARHVGDPIRICCGKKVETDQ